MKHYRPPLTDPPVTPSELLGIAAIILLVLMSGIVLCIGSFVIHVAWVWGFFE